MSVLPSDRLMAEKQALAKKFALSPKDANSQRH